MDTDPTQTGDLANGDTAPDFHLPAGDGHEVALATYRRRAHVILFFVRAYG